MWVDKEKIASICLARGLSLNSALRAAGVSKTAYYAATANATLLSQSLILLAEELRVSPLELLSWGPPELLKARLRSEKLKKIMKRFPKASGENIWHALILLEMSPIERLRAALRRGR